MAWVSVFDEPFTLEGSYATSGLNIIYESNDSSVIQVESNGLLRPVALGTVRITLKQPGDSHFSAASNKVFDLKVISNNTPSNLTTVGLLTIAENQPIGTIVGDFNATDPDGGAITYSLTYGKESWGEGLLAYYPFNGNGLDYSGNDNHPTSTVGTPSWTAGMVGQCLDGNQSNYFEISNNAALAGKHWSVSAWYKMASTSATSGFISRMDSNSYSSDYFFGTGGAYFRWGTGGASDSGAWLTKAEPTLNQWHHIVGTIQQDTSTSGEKKLFIDGSLSVTKSYSVRGTSTSSVNLGKADALLDELRIYERVLSDQEVSSLYNLGLQGETGLNDIFLFTLDSNGTLKTATTFDYESNVSSYTITVQAKDELNATTEGNFTVTLSNANDPPTGIVTISGTAEVGQTLSVSNTLSDPDGLGAITYTWYPMDNQLFDGGTLKDGI